MIRPPNEKTTLTEYDRQLMQSVPLLTGKELTLETPATFAQQKLPHGLGRPYRGAFQLCTNTLSQLVIIDPSLQDDSATNLTFVDVVGVGGTTLLWVF